MAIIPASIRNANPGAMYPGRVSKLYGATTYETLRSKDGVHKIATFPSAVHGAAAQFRLLHDNYTGLTIEAAIKKWCGGYYASTYLNVLEEKAGITKASILTKGLVRDPHVAIPLCKAMAWQEAGRDFPLQDDEWLTAHRMAFGGEEAPYFAADNDVPSPKPETRRREAIKTTSTVATVVTGTGAVVTGIADNGVPSVPRKAVESITNVSGWIESAGKLKGQSGQLVGEPLLLIGVGMIALIWFGPRLIGRLRQ